MSYRDKNNIPIYPGAYYMNNGTLLSGGNCVAMFPIFGSIYDYSKYYFSDNADNYYLVLPGFKLVVYVNSGYSGNTSTCDNTNGTTIQQYSLPNYVDQGSSCKLYYNNVELSSVYTPNDGTTSYYSPS